MPHMLQQNDVLILGPTHKEGKETKRVEDAWVGDLYLTPQHPNDKIIYLRTEDTQHRRIRMHLPIDYTGAYAYYNITFQ